jgi:hypothetical protein
MKLMSSIFPFRYFRFLYFLISISAASAQTTQPTAIPLPPNYELRTMQTLANKEFKQALPMLRKLEMSAAASGNKQKLAQIQEYIRVCQRNIADPAAAAAFDPKTMLVDPNDPPTAPDKRKVHQRPTGDAPYALTIKELGNFDYDAERGGNVPDDVKALDGAKVRLNGFMLPMDSSERISTFALVPSALSCCFGGPPGLQHTIIVHAPSGKALSYFPDEIVCEGTLKVEEKKDDEFIVSLFELNVNSVKPAVR